MNIIVLSLLTLLLPYSSFANGQAGKAVAGGIMIDGSTVFSGSTHDTGIVEKEKRMLPGFSQIDLSGFAGQVYIGHGNENMVVVAADSSVVSSVTTEVEGDVLKVRVKKNISTTKPLQINIYARYFSSVLAGGIANVVIEDVNNIEEFHVNVNDSASVSAQGKVNKIKAIVSGNGKLQFQYLSSEECTVSVSGVGRAFVNAKKRITARAFGAGSIIYSGHPDVLKKVQGIGKVEPAR